MGQDSHPVWGSQWRQGPWCDGSYGRPLRTLLLRSWVVFPTADWQDSLFSGPEDNIIQERKFLLLAQIARL